MSKLSLRAIMLLCAAVMLLTMGAAALAEEATQPAKPVAYTEKIEGTVVTFDMVPVPAGEITVPDPAKKGATMKVSVGPFFISKTEVTWDEYDVFTFRLDEPKDTKPLGRDATSHPSKPYGEADRGYGRRGYPVINATYFGAVQYCKWLSTKTGKTYRLPTEAEWEQACRAGQPDPSSSQLSKCAWCSQSKTQAVGKLAPNACGTYDMLGNVAEWAVDMSGKPVVCGGSFEDKPEKVKASSRKYQTEDWQANDPQDPKSKWWLSDGQFVGFRVICVENPAPAAK